MPVDLEMFLSHTGANLFDYTPFVNNQFSFTNSYEENGFIQNFPFFNNHIFIPNDSKNETYVDKKGTRDSSETAENSKSSRKVFGFAEDGRKKKVSFADDKGFSLVEIREIPGAIAWPAPSLSPLMDGIKGAVTQQKNWKLAFEHPPWTDDKIIELLEINKVALESVNVKKKSDNVLEGIVKVKGFNFTPVVTKESSLSNSAENVLQGTIKVKNLAYDKKVFVRISFDRWLSSTDITANFVQPGKTSQKQPGYDTFSFNIDLPPSALKYEVIEFCICFSCNRQEYWDNNGGINYRLVTEIVSKNEEPMVQNNISNDRITLSLTENIEKFSEIDSWNSFMLNQPYW